MRMLLLSLICAISVAPHAFGTRPVGDSILSPKRELAREHLRPNGDFGLSPSLDEASLSNVPKAVFDRELLKEGQILLDGVVLRGKCFSPPLTVNTTRKAGMKRGFHLTQDSNCRVVVSDLIEEPNLSRQLGGATPTSSNASVLLPMISEYRTLLYRRDSASKKSIAWQWGYITADSYLHGQGTVSFVTTTGYGWDSAFPGTIAEISGASSIYPDGGFDHGSILSGNDPYDVDYGPATTAWYRAKGSVWGVDFILPGYFINEVTITGAGGAVCGATNASWSTGDFYGNCY